MKKLILAILVCASSVTFTVFAEESFSPKPRRNAIEDTGFTNTEKAPPVESTHKSNDKKNFDDDLAEQNAAIEEQVKMMEDLKAKSEELLKQMQERQNASDSE